MKNILLLLIGLFFASAVTASLVSNDSAKFNEPKKPEKRCGWFINPTPANAWLIDRDGEWTIGVQGGYQAEGDWPAFSDKQWVETNVHYGYGCSCINAQIDHKTNDVVEIFSSYARPLSACRKDPKIRKKEPK